MTLTYDDIADRVNDHQVAFDELAAADKAKHRHRVQPFRTRGFAAIGLHNPKTPENVGGVIRAAHAYSAASVAISGDRINGRPITHPTNTTRADKHIPIYRGDLRDLIPFGAVPVAIELVDDAESLFTFKHPRSAFYIFGPEDSGLGRSVRDWCAHVVQVPTAVCMNIAACVNVVLYDRMMKEHIRTQDVTSTFDR